jgi:hypothetical protein
VIQAFTDVLAELARYVSERIATRRSDYRMTAFARSPNTAKPMSLTPTACGFGMNCFVGAYLTLSTR